DSHESRWMKDIKSKVHSLGLSPDLLLTTEYSKARCLLAQRIHNIKYQNNFPSLINYVPGMTIQ
ncbi:hypothetical protein JRQ81_013729, partial [Phrynocephalus forsythii]